MRLSIEGDSTAHSNWTKHINQRTSFGASHRMGRRLAAVAQGEQILGIAITAPIPHAGGHITTSRGTSSRTSTTPKRMLPGRDVGMTDSNQSLAEQGCSPRTRHLPAGLLITKQGDLGWIFAGGEGISDAHAGQCRTAGQRAFILIDKGSLRDALLARGICLAGGQLDGDVNQSRASNARQCEAPAMHVESWIPRVANPILALEHIAGAAHKLPTGEPEGPRHAVALERTCKRNEASEEKAERKRRLGHLIVTLIKVDLHQTQVLLHNGLHNAASATGGELGKPEISQGAMPLLALAREAGLQCSANALISKSGFGK
jgi:hypothetical protein